MKIGASTLATFKNGFGYGLEFIEDLGMKYAEIIHQGPIDLDVLNSFNLKYSVHSPLIDINIASLTNSIKKASIGEMKNSIKLANKIDADIVVVHPGTIPFLGRGDEDKICNISKESIKEIGDYGKDLGVTVAIENMPEIDVFIYKNIYDLDNLLQDLNMSMTLDIGHANTVGFSANEMYFDSIKHIHLSDNNGDDDSHYALGEGSIDFKTCINNFEDKKYDGIYMIEVNNTDSVKKSYEYIKKL